MIQKVFPHPERSCRLKRSAKTLMSSQNQITQSEEDEHRPEDIQKRIVRSYHHVALLSFARFRYCRQTADVRTRSSPPRAALTRWRPREWPGVSTCMHWRSFTAAG